MPTALPMVTRREIVREYRPDDTVTVDSGIRALRGKHALSDGLSFVARGAGGELGGRVHLYCALNRDAARAARRSDFASAVRICKAAARLERSHELRQLVDALAESDPTTIAVPGEPTHAGAAALAQAFSSPGLADHVAKVQRRLQEARAQLHLEAAPTILSGRVSTLLEAVAILTLQGDLNMPVPRAMIEAACVHEVGSPVSATWELLPGGRTLLTVEPAVETPDVNEMDEPLVDIYGTPWGNVLSSVDEGALMVKDEPTVSIPAGVPDVE